MVTVALAYWGLLWIWKKVAQSHTQQSSHGSPQRDHPISTLIQKNCAAAWLRYSEGALKGLLHSGVPQVYSICNCTPTCL